MTDAAVLDLSEKTGWRRFEDFPLPIPTPAVD